MTDSSSDETEYYKANYHLQVHSGHFSDDVYYWARAIAVLRLNFRSIDLTEQTSVLEFGCGYGQNIACLANAWGYDISELARTEARRHGVRIYERVSDIPHDAFDVVLSRHCLEHLEDPLQNLRLIRTLLKHGGKLVLILPKEGHALTPYAPDVHQHLYCWNFRTINNLVHRAGFEVQSNCYQSVVGYKALLPLRRLLGKDMYYRATLVAGRVFNVTELVVHARRPDK